MNSFYEFGMSKETLESKREMVDRAELPELHSIKRLISNAFDCGYRNAKHDIYNEAAAIVKVSEKEKSET